MTEKGVTLIELLVVVSIIGVLMVALGFSVEGWKSRYDVESATRQLYADLQDARTRGLHSDSDYFAVISATDNARLTTPYSIVKDTNFDGRVDSGDSTITSFPKTIDYKISGAPATITFDNRGLISPNYLTISIVSDYDPDYDCITLSTTKIELGKYKDTGGVGKCVER